MELMKFYPQYRFATASDFYFDAADETIFYNSKKIDSDDGKIALLHEIAHAELAHFDFATDFELFAMETRAWDYTRTLARQFKLPLAEDFVIDCLSTYANWLEKRSACPACDNFSLQTDRATYRCFRCQTRWQVHTDSLERVHRVRLSDN